MKNGLLVYTSYFNLFNIGDYIQSLAARQYLIKPFTYLNRERLDAYDEEPVNIVMNGWFLHEPEHWPPSSKINPLFVSFHLNSLAYKILENKQCVEYFKKHEPIGCRDHVTCEHLKAKGIDAYFTGCLTLTLGESFKSIEKTDEIIFVDPYFDVNKSIISTLYYLLYFITHANTVLQLKSKMYSGKSLFHILRAACFYMQYKKIFDKSTLLNVSYYSHKVKDSDFKSEEEKFDYAEFLISKYAKAKFVVTTRLHCALPCLGLETPVVYIENKNQTETSYCRFKGIREYLNIISYSEGNFESSDIDINNIDFSAIKNKTNHIQAKNDLIKRCNEYFSNTQRPM